MAQFVSAFRPSDDMHRIQMLQLMSALSTEISTGLGHKINFLAHAKRLGWVPSRCQKKTALRLLVDQAKTGFGYVPSKTVKKALGEEEA